jgi:hypothetical protein
VRALGYFYKLRLRKACRGLGGYAVVGPSRRGTIAARRFTPGGFCSEKSPADIEAKGDHAEGSEQADTTKQNHDLEWTRIGPCPGGFTHQSGHCDLL